MKTFMAVYIGTAEALGQSGWEKMDEAKRREREKLGMEAWMQWGEENRASIVDIGTPLGKTKRISPQGVADARNDICGYVIVRAESHEAAARLFEGHPHFTIFPGDSVEVMECLPLPAM